jgi:hypothetical protein
VTQRQQQQRLLQQQQLQSQKVDSSPPPLLPPSASNSVQGKGVASITSKIKPTTAAVTATTTTALKSPDPRQRASRINGARTPLQVQSQTVPLHPQAQVRFSWQMCLNLKLVGSSPSSIRLQCFSNVTFLSIRNSNRYIKIKLNYFHLLPLSKLLK